MNKQLKLPSLILSTIIILLSISTNVLPKSIVITNKNDNEIIIKKANEAATKKDYKKAIELYNKVITKNPKDEESMINLGYLYYLVGQTKEAKELFQQILSISKTKSYIAYSKQVLEKIKEEENKKSKENEDKKTVENNKNEKDVKKNDKKEDKKTTNKNIIEIDTKKENTYICAKNSPTISLDKDGKYFRRWEKDYLPLKIYIPNIPEEISKDSSKYKELTKLAINKWMEKDIEIIRLYFTNIQEKANIIVKWSEYYNDTDWSSNNNMPKYDKKTKKITGVFNIGLKPQMGSGLFSNKTEFFTDEDFTQVVTHEFGHILGLGHSFNTDENKDIMRQNFKSLPDGEKAEITQRDIDTLKKLYSFPKDATCICK